MIHQPEIYSDAELDAMGILHGRGCKVSRRARLYVNSLRMGHHCRIDDFAILTGDIEFGNRVHIPPQCMLYGRLGIRIGNHAGMAPRTTLYSEIDDYSGQTLLGPCSPEWSKTNRRQGPVVIENYAQLGHGCTVFPGVTLREGAICGAHSLVLESMEPWTINVGTPCKFLKPRSRALLPLAARLDEEDAADTIAEQVPYLPGMLEEHELNQLAAAAAYSIPHHPV
jgi:acetyltransferase-like isoleucine patch superfamily enzyme